VAEIKRQDSVVNTKLNTVYLTAPLDLEFLNFAGYMIRAQRLYIYLCQ